MERLYKNVKDTGFEDRMCMREFDNENRRWVETE
jgi:hypothetical protein